VAIKKVKIKNVLYILAGSKAEENMKFMQKDKKIIAGGKFGQMIMMSKGFKFGKHEEYLDKEGIDKLKSYRNVKVITPVDFAVKEREKRKEILIEDFPNDYEIFDIGEKTIERFKEEIMKAKAIFMKGPLGYIEEKKFQKGTEEIMKAIVKSKAFSVLGGGHLSTALKQLGVDKKKFGHISLSGGALATYMAGEKLPGLEVLNR
jgi:phosphoglycerate kinase